MKTTLDKWKQVTVKGLVAQTDRLTAEIEAMLKERDEIGTIIKALGSTPPKANGKVPQVHWSKKPGVDPKQIAAWKAKMSRVQRKLGVSRRNKAHDGA